VSFFSNNTVAMRGDEADDRISYVRSSTPFVISENADYAEKRIKLGSPLLRFTPTFGLAPAKLISNLAVTHETFGYHCSSALRLYGEGVENGVQWKQRRMSKGSVVHLRLHRNRSVSIVLDGEDLGVAFRGVNVTEPLYLAVVMWCEGDCVELLPELV
jgi:hypothetical protein